jgi:hypothetical protein
VTDAVNAIFVLDPPRFMQRTPHGYHDKTRIETDLRAAGFAEIRIETVPKTSVAPSPRHAAIAYCQGTPLRNEIEARGGTHLDEVTNLVEQAIAHAYGKGAVSGRIQAHVVTARAACIQSA